MYYKIKTNIVYFIFSNLMNMQKLLPYLTSNRVRDSFVNSFVKLQSINIHYNYVNHKSA